MDPIAVHVRPSAGTRTGSVAGSFTVTATNTSGYSSTNTVTVPISPAAT
ncbi:MAG: hypothetical protein WCE30_12465 [Mycobacterium sp.]